MSIGLRPRAAAAGLLLLLGAAGPTGPAAEPVPTAPVAVEHHLLPGGLEVLLKPEPGRDVVSIQTWYRIGSRDESGETLGFAHLFEHLMSTGTPAVPDFGAAITAVGGTSGSAVWPDVTLFYLDLPAASVRRALEIEADRMQHLTLAPSTIAASVEIAGIELAAVVQNAPLDFVRDRLRAMAYGDHPYGRPAMAAAAQADSAACRAFYERHFRPDNACLIVAGAFEPAATLALIREIFSPLAPAPGAPAATERPPPPPASTIEPSPRREALDLGTGVPTLAVAYVVPGRQAVKEAASLRLLAAYLNGPGQGYWGSRLRTDQGRPVVARLVVETALDRYAGLVMVTASLVDAAVAAEIEPKLLSALAGLGTAIAGGDLGDGEPIDLDALRRQELYRWLSARGTAGARASALGTCHLLRGSYEHYGREREQLAAVELADLVSVAGLLQADRAVVVTLATTME